MTTHQEILEELTEKRRDLEVFLQARSLIRQRVVELMDSECKLTPLPRWSGTDAVLGSLDLCIHAMERTLDELEVLLQTTPDLPRLRVIRGEAEKS